MALEPYRSSTPWSKALERKKVLVVHPFEESIQHQYAIHEKIFKNQDILPDFELITYKAIQTNAGGICDFNTWFEALDTMFEDIKKIDFDIAIIGCGAYGLPLAAKIKSLDKASYSSCWRHTNFVWNPRCKMGCKTRNAMLL